MRMRDNDLSHRTSAMATTADPFTDHCGGHSGAQSLGQTEVRTCGVWMGPIMLLHLVVSFYRSRRKSDARRLQRHIVLASRRPIQTASRAHIEARVPRLPSLASRTHRARPSLCDPERLPKETNQSMRPRSMSRSGIFGKRYAEKSGLPRRSKFSKNRSNSEPAAT